jgi:hypothetical protein
MNYPQLASPEVWVSTSLSSFLAKLSVDFCRFFAPSCRIAPVCLCLLLDGKVGTFVLALKLGI